MNVFDDIKQYPDIDPRPKHKIMNIKKLAEEKHVFVLVNALGFDIKNECLAAKPYLAVPENSKDGIPKYGVSLIERDGQYIITYPEYDTVIYHGGCMYLFGKLSKKSNGEQYYIYDVYSFYGKLIRKNLTNCILSSRGGLLTIDNAEVIHDEEVVIPKGRYSWVGGFEYKYAIVRKDPTSRFSFQKPKYGLVDYTGMELLRVEYDNIELLKYKEDTDVAAIVTKNAKETRFTFNDLRNLPRWFGEYRRDSEAQEIWDTQNYVPWGEKMREIKDSYRDAYEGLADACWNTD